MRLASKILRATAVASAVTLRALTIASAGGDPAASGWHFVDVTDAAGVGLPHGIAAPPEFFDLGLIAGGVAAGDYDRDGHVDLFVVAGDAGADRLYRNLGDGRFDERAEAAGVDLRARIGCGPLFVDLDGDAFLDLVVLGVAGAKPIVFRNLGDGTFEDVTARTGITVARNGVSAAAGDYDLDGDLDLFLAQWGGFDNRGHLWRNDGDWRFTDVDEESGVAAVFAGVVDWSLSPNFADLDADGWPDILVAADFGTSRVLRNRRDGTFRDVTTAAISDENGMGTALGDFDGDGDLDWFVSSVFDARGAAIDRSWGQSGNRLYQNRGDGRFDDVTGAAGVRAGGWGWAASFADLDLDGRLDLIHTNGYASDDPDLAPFRDDATVLFRNAGDGRFAEIAAAIGADDRGDGRGVVCFDYDSDGDIDVFIANRDARPALLRNDGLERRAWLSVRLRGRAPNTEAIGARVIARTGAALQMRELRCGSNYASQDPAVAHFGLGDANVVDELVDELVVRWPGGAVTRLERVAPRQNLVLDEPAPPRFVRGDANADMRIDLADVVAPLAHVFLGEALACADAADANDDGRLEIADAVTIAAFLLGGGRRPAAPFPDCGSDRSIDSLECAVELSESCR